jgi:hypothetical protein
VQAAVSRLVRVRVRVRLGIRVRDTAHFEVLPSGTNSPSDVHVSSLSTLSHEAAACVSDDSMPLHFTEHSEIRKLQKLSSTNFALAGG